MALDKWFADFRYSNGEEIKKNYYFDADCCFTDSEIEYTIVGDLITDETIWYSVDYVGRIKK